MHRDHGAFISGIVDRTKVVLTFVSKEDAGLLLSRTCAPMDYGPSSFAKNKANRYHFWDYDSDSPSGRHTLKENHRNGPSLVSTPAPSWLRTCTGRRAIPINAPS